jgi:hypothetical protein
MGITGRKNAGQVKPVAWFMGTLEGKRTIVEVWLRLFKNVLPFRQSSRDLTEGLKDYFHTEHRGGRFLQNGNAYVHITPKETVSLPRTYPK